MGLNCELLVWLRVEINMNLMSLKLELICRILLGFILFWFYVIVVVYLNNMYNNVFKNL